jgi:hypothetical protein
MKRRIVIKEMHDWVSFMSTFMRLDSNAPATFGAVVEAVTPISTLSEAKILALVSAGKIAEVFPYAPAAKRAVPVDTVAEAELVETSAGPLNQRQRDALIASSLPAATEQKRRASGKR